MATRAKNHRTLPPQGQPWDHYYDWFLRHTRGDHAATEDLLQKLRVKVLRWPCQKPASYDSYILTCAHSVLTESQRHWCTHGGPVSVEFEKGANCPDPDPLPEEALGRAELIAQVRAETDRVLRMLPRDSKIRAAIEHYHGPAVELAARLGITPEAVRANRHRGLKLLAESPILQRLFRELLNQHDEPNEEEPGEHDPDDE